MFSDHIQHFLVFLEPVNFFFTPSKRVFWPFLIGSAAIVCSYCLLNRNRVERPTERNATKVSAWWNRSTWVDIQWLWVNHCVKIWMLLPLLGGQLSASLFVNNMAFRLFGEGDFFHLPATYVTALFTFSLFMVDDFSRFLVHLCYHKIPLLWRFHAIHHSATTLTPLTLYRVHCLEMCINVCRGLFSVGLVSGIFMYVFHGGISVFNVMGVSIATMLFNAAGANLRHSPFWIGFGPLEAVFISPAQHQIHHSCAAEHHDKNFGSCLALWDRLFSTWLPSKNQHVEHFGLAHVDKPNHFSKHILGLQ